jgi:hypothetical protein
MRRKLQSHDNRDPLAFLRVIERNGPCSSYCPRCGKTVSGGTYCSECNRPDDPVFLKFVG